MASQDNDQIYKDFKNNVNMTPAQLKKWLDSDEAKSVGWSKTSGKNTGSSTKTEGYKSGKNIITMLEKNKPDLTDHDFSEMKRVSGYIKRHLNQKPSKEDIKDSRWRYSLMNWGHDPLK